MRASFLSVFLVVLLASVTHELGQPIAAMRNHLAVAKLQGQGGPMLPRLRGLVDRMEGITRHLKFFARKGKQEFEHVDLRDAIHAVLELMRPSVDAHEVTLDVVLPDEPVVLHSNRLWIEPVITNLMRNAVNAMVNCDRRVLSVALGQDGDAVWFTVSMAVYQHPAVVKDLGRWNATLLMLSPLPHYNIVGTGDAPSTLADFDGLSARATGGIGAAMKPVGALLDAERDALLSSVDEALAHYVDFYNDQTMAAWDPALDARGSISAAALILAPLCGAATVR